MVTELKITDWYPGTVKPVRIGWYEVKTTMYNGRMRYWNGACWMDSCLCCKCFDQEKPWRGLANGSV